MKKRIISLMLAVIMIVSLLPVAAMPAFADGECQHTDTDEDGYCDTCEIAVESSVTLFAPIPVTRILKAGTNIKEAMSDILVSQGVEATAWFYVDKSTVGDTDTVPYGIEILEIYPTVYYKAEQPVCGEGGHMAYYYNPFNGMYYEDESLTQLIGFDTKYDGLEAWLYLEDGGYIPPTEKHTFECCENRAYGHFCTNEDCMYHTVPKQHVLSPDKTYCIECGAKCYQACNGSGLTISYACANKFENDGQPLEHSWYYVDESVTLDEVLIIAGYNVRLILADGVAFDAAKGYHCLPGCSFSVYYESGNAEEKGVFTGTEYKCYDASSGEYFETHENVANLICSRCSENTCTHYKTWNDFTWSADCSSCHYEIKCFTCSAVLEEGDMEIETELHKKGDCKTKTQIMYRASFYSEAFGSLNIHEYVETEYGAHNMTNELMNYCEDCRRTDPLGAVVDTLEIFEVGYFITSDEMWMEYIDLLKEAKTEKEINKVIEEFYNDFEDADYDKDTTLTLLEKISKTDDTILKYAQETKYPSSVYKLLREYLPSLKTAASAESYDSILKTAEAAATRLVNLKGAYIEIANGTYETPEGYSIDEYDFMQIILGIYYAWTEEGIIEAFQLKTLEETKENAKKAIDDVAGENQSAAVQKIVKDAKDAIDGAITKSEVNTLKFDAFAAIRAQVKKEAEEAAALAEAKIQAKKDIDEAAGEKQSAAIQKIVADAKTAIDGADSIEKLETEKQKGLSAIEAQHKKEAEAKIQAKKDIDEAAGIDPSPIVETLVNAAKKLIDNASSVEEVSEIRDEWVTVIVRLISGEDEQALTEAKTAMKAEIDKAVDGASNEIKNYAATAKANIDDCTSIKELVGVYTAELNKINAMKTQKAIAAALAELDNAAKNAVAAKSKAIAQAAKPLIENAESAEEANAVLSEALKKIAGEEKTLSDAKTAAKAAVDSAAGSKQSEAMKKIVSEVKAAIDSAKSTEEVAKAQQEGTARIEAQKEAEKPTEPTDPGSGSFLSKLLDSIRNIFKNIFDTLFGWLPFC